ncbi:MAG: amidohydrolase family protein [Candidatus Cryptobacteroides sp.]|nr:amidohydrolase family protein [Candidatus Cryptobacteroides sp.]
MKEKGKMLVFESFKVPIAVIGLVMGMGMFTYCSESDKPSSSEKADLVVYGKIFTAEDNELVEAFAVKDGKYVYVGDKAGAAAYVQDGKTEVVDYSGEGLVMPGCGNGHAHYATGASLWEVGTFVGYEDDVDTFLGEIVPAAVRKARETGATLIFGLGWNVMLYPEDLPYRKLLDDICSDIPIYIADDEGHKALVNSATLVKAGIMKADGTVMNTDIRGGEIVLDEDGTPSGYVKEQAGTYIRSFMDYESIFSLDLAKESLEITQEQLLSEGYTMCLDGWSTYFFNENLYEAAQQLDLAGDLHFVLGTAYELESWMNVDEVLSKAAAVQKYATTHVRTNWLKLFMDGTVESGTGFIDPIYPDGHQGNANWSEEELTEITRKANEKGLTMHVHAMGNTGVNRVVNAFISGGKDEMRNTLVHVYNVLQADYLRMAEHNIHVAASLLWHYNDTEFQEALLEILPAGLNDKGYPLKSFFDYGINVSSHTDFPATSDAPDDPFGIMEIAVTGVYQQEPGKPWWPEELLTREQALTALTINVARQMFLENERGSICTGKYADFLLLNQDVLTCPADQIHATEPVATYFEGTKVYPM